MLVLAEARTPGRREFNETMVMRVGILTTSFPLPELPGSGIFVERLVVRLAERADVIVLTPASNRGDPAPSERSAYTLRYFKYAPRSWCLIAHQPGGIPVALREHRWLFLLIPAFLIAMFLACLWRFRRVDVIHANWAACGAVAGVAGHLLGKPVVTTLRGSDVKRIERSKLDRLLLRICLATNAKVVGVSDTIVHTIGDRFPAVRKKLRMIPNGVADEFFAVTRGDRCVGMPLRFLAVGNLIALKSLETALTAFAATGIEDSEFVFIGDGPEKPRLQALAQKLGVAERIHFHGALPPEEIPARLREADVFVFTSISEGRPNAVLEAMAAALPIAASRIDGVTELLRDEDTGLLFEPGDADALAVCLTRLAGDPALRRRLGTAARQSLIDRGLTWARTAEEYLAVYQDCLSPGLEEGPP